MPKLFFMVLAIGFTFDAMALSAVEKRIQPIGQVQTEVKQANSTASSKDKATTEDEKEAQLVDLPVKVDGKQIYDKYCFACHTSGIAGAPKFRNTQDWAPRVKKGMKQLVSSVQNGLKAMPPKGTCTQCNANDFKAAIEYMMPQNSEDG